MCWFEDSGSPEISSRWPILWFRNSKDQGEDCWSVWWGPFHGQGVQVDTWWWWKGFWQNILREVADRLIQTAEHLGRVASLSSANSGASSLPATSSVVAAASGNVISNISSANRSPPIALSAASEHTRLFGYGPPVAGNVRSHGTSARGRARGRSNYSAPYHLHHQGLLLLCLHLIPTFMNSCMLS